MVQTGAAPTPEGHIVNKAQLIDAVAMKLDISRRSAGDTVDAVLDGITGAIISGDKVSLTGFGTFETTRRAARTARNPRTGESVAVPAATVPKFRPGQALKDEVNTTGRRKPAAKKTAAKKTAAKKTVTRPAAKKATTTAASTTRTAAKKATTVKAAAKKTATTAKTAAKKTTAKAAAKKTVAKKTTARPTAKRVATKAPATKAVAKKTTVKKAAAKKTTARKR